MIRCGSKNGHQKVMCLKEIGLHAQNTLSILGSIDLYDQLMNTRNLHLEMNKICIRDPKIMREMATFLI